MKLVLQVTTALLALLFALACSAQSFTGSNLGAIADGIGPGPEAYGPPRDIHFDVAALRTVSGVSVRFTATHAYVGDLRVTLIAPNGNSHLLFARSGVTIADTPGFSSGLNGQYLFIDSAPTNWWSGAAINPVPPGSYRTVISGGAGVANPPPVTSLNAQFLSTPANGRWILRFEDGWVGFAGNVSAAQLDLTLVGNTRTVTNANDSGAGSLREVMQAANGGDLINFAMPFFASPRVIEIESALPPIDRNLAIQGPGAQLLTVRRRIAAVFPLQMRIFGITSATANVTLSGMTLQNGRMASPGGAILSTGPLTLSDMHLTGNQGDTGGALALTASAQIINSTLSGNFGVGQGGAIHISGNGSAVRIANSTNSATAPRSWDPQSTWLQGTAAPTPSS